MYKQIALFIISTGTAWGVMYSLKMPDLWFWLFLFSISYLMFVFSSEKKELLEGIKKTKTYPAILVVALSVFVVFGDEIVTGSVRLLIMSSFLISFFNVTDKYFAHYLKSDKSNSVDS